MYRLSYLFLLFSTFSWAQNSKVIETASLPSSILGMERNYAVYLPPGYEENQREYPVLYLLHGATDNQTGWVQFGEVQHLTDRAIQAGKATAMVIIMPDADTKVMGYNNLPDWKYEDFFFNEFMPFVESKYRIKKSKRYRAIAGLSMGGGGTLVYAMHRPDLFSSACPLSAWVGPLSLEDTKQMFSRRNATYTELEIQNYFETYNALNISKNTEDAKLKSVRWYIDCGDDDFLFEGNSLLHIDWKKRGIPHEYRVRDGAHTWTYWRESLPEVLHFVSQAFHQY